MLPNRRRTHFSATIFIIHYRIGFVNSFLEIFQNIFSGLLFLDGVLRNVLFLGTIRFFLRKGRIAVIGI